MKIVDDFDRQPQFLRDNRTGLPSADERTRNDDLGSKQLGDPPSRALRLLAAAIGQRGVRGDREATITVTLAFPMAHHDELAAGYGRLNGSSFFLCHDDESDFSEVSRQMLYRHITARTAVFRATDRLATGL